MATASAANAQGKSVVLNVVGMSGVQRSGMSLWKTSSQDRSTLALTGRAAVLTGSPLHTSLNTTLVVYMGKLNVRFKQMESVLRNA